MAASKDKSNLATVFIPVAFADCDRFMKDTAFARPCAKGVKNRGKWVREHKLVMEQSLSIARESSAKIYELFLDYKAKNDFVGMDMARKFLQMGYTRARRYANHASGKKYDGLVPNDKKGQSGAHGREQLPRQEDPVKAESARIFYGVYVQAREDPEYKKLRKEWQQKYG